MIVAWEPGGTVAHARVVLKPDETLPARFNVKEATVYREDGEGGWVTIKTRGSVLPKDSELLTKPEFPEVSLELTEALKNDKPFEHPDIITIGDDNGREQDS